MPFKWRNTGNLAGELSLGALNAFVSQLQIALASAFRYGLELAPVAANFHRFASPGR